MSGNLIAFLGFGLVTLAAGVGLAITRNIVHAAFLFFVVLFGTAALFVFAGAEFLAVSQVIVYVGGILIVMLFGVMLTHKLRETKPKTRIINWVPGLLVSGILLAGLVYISLNFEPHQGPVSEVLEYENVVGSGKKAEILLPGNHRSPLWPNQETQLLAENDRDVETIGTMTITEFLLPFEVISILLLVALIGAAYIARKSKKEVRHG